MVKGVLGLGFYTDFVAGGFPEAKNGPIATFPDEIGDALEPPVDGPAPLLL